MGTIRSTRAIYNRNHRQVYLAAWLQLVCVLPPSHEVPTVLAARIPGLVVSERMREGLGVVTL